MVLTLNLLRYLLQIKHMWNGLQNVMDACIGALVWWAVGFAFAYGDDGVAPNAFVGGKVSWEEGCMLICQKVRPSVCWSSVGIASVFGGCCMRNI